MWYFRKMHWIVDSGGTKASWANEKKEVYDFEGINPNIQKNDAIIAILTQVIKSLNLSGNDSITWYGAGCSNSIAIEKLKTAFNSLGFKRVKVNHDLLAAARAVLGNNKGVVGIMGTGSNACFYDGRAVVAEKTSLGYVMGDEGGAAYFGKRLFKDFVDGTMPQTEAKLFGKEFGDDKQTLVAKFYASTAPSAHLGAFAKILDAFDANSAYKKTLLNEGFDAYFKLFVEPFLSKENDLSIGFVGSVAHIYQSILSEKSNNLGLKFLGVNRNPISALVDWHIKNEHIPF